ncbi:XrtA system polysaccharide chain length determinant [Desertibaculum subflavum]|uniref:XrtA system polysaccharide chain length determinant n=1 Tax=Desertibaculum subflavum TaxID=2268458 RepID=UPI000E673587
MNSIAELLPELLAYARGAWKRRWIALALAWLICLVGWAVVAVLPNNYSASTRVYVDTDSLLAPLLKGLTVEPNLAQQVQVMQRTLLTRPNVERVIRMADLDLKARNQQEHDALVESLSSRIEILGDRGARNLFAINYSSSDAAEALRVVQSLLTIFVESNVGDSRREMEQAQAFLNRQIADYERQLQEAERRLSEFKQENIGKLPQEGTAYQALGSAEVQVQAARRELGEAQIRLEAIQRQLRETSPTLAVESAPVVMIDRGRQLSSEEETLSSRLKELQTSLDSLTLRFTDKHPDVAQTRRQIASVQADLDAARKRAEEEGRNRPAGSPGSTRARSTVSNPVYEQLRIRQGDAEANLELAQRRLSEAEALYKQRVADTSQAAALEARQANLNRDYGVIKKQYDELLARRESARLAQAKDDRRDTSLSFRIVEPPTQPSKPSGPPRLLYASMILVAGLAAGAALAVLLTLLDDSMATIAKVRRTFAYPVLGAVSRLTTSVERRQKAMAIVGFAAVTGALVVIYGGVMVATPKFPLSPSMLGFL